MITCVIGFRLMVSVYSVTHFLVDFACAFLMFSGIAGATDWFFYVLIYNFCAFAMQLPLGIVADRLNRNALFAAVGCALVVAAYALVGAPLAAVVVVGIGNGMFHIGGGIDVLNHSETKSGALGVFVSPGAFGIYFGTMLGKQSALPPVLICLSLVAAAALILITRRARGGAYRQNAEFSLDGGTSRDMIVAAICLFVVVCLRSYLGLVLNFPWKSAGYWGLLLVCAVVLGKTIGGFAADRFGMVRVSVTSLGIAALLFLASQMPVAGVLAVLLFNVTMPITLWAMARIFPGAKGFSFGLLTFGLFLGFLPAQLGGAVSGGLWYFAFAAASLASLWAGLRRLRL